MTFDLVRTPLDKGVTRLEASAGTGKTFALAGLFLRLLLEEKVPAREILVVTFTEAATAELRDRIRKRLSHALAVIEGKPSADPLLTDLAARIAPRRNAAVLSLHGALEAFDLISIHTIHSFCQRTLQESAFESGALFDVELVSDQERLIRETAADYCRQQLHGCDELLASAAMRAQLNPYVLSCLLKQFLTYPELELTASPPPRPLEATVHVLRSAFSQCPVAWSSAGGRAGLLGYFLAGKKWAVKDHAKRDTLDAHAACLEACLEAATLSPEIWDALEFFSTSAVRAETGKGKDMPDPPPRLFELCENLAGCIGEFATAHRLAFLGSAGNVLAQRKQEAKQQSFDDLISRLAAALDGPSGPALAHYVRRKFRAALIDESQDTDPLQWKIFKRVFAESPGHWLYLIGDPKQAIYGFRGADVKTYLEAAATAGHEYSLGTNWRSESALVRAVNSLFSSAGRSRAFLEDDILFEAVNPAPTADSQPLRFPPGNQRPPPFQVWSWESEKGPVTSKAARKLLPASVAAEISRLLNLKVLLAERRAVQPRDIAVLVESHKQAGWIQSALHDLRIPSVEQAMESVFESDEARELQWILEAVLAPARESSLKSALTTDALGLDGNQLAALVSDEVKWQARLQAFARYRAIWEQDGFFFMFVQLLRQERVLESLLRFADAERRITNVLQVAELLEATCASDHLGPCRLVQWLEDRRTRGDAPPDAFQLRLESDEDAVRIVTIHRAKGLEYPIVFCPFVSKDARSKSIKAEGRKVLDVVLYHDPATKKLTWDLSAAPDETRARLAKSELLAEKVRLLYVALTRARNRCYLVSARYARNKSTALAWLMHRSPGVPHDAVGDLEKEVVAVGAWKSRWDDVAAASATPVGRNPGIAVEDMPKDPGEPWSPGHIDSARLASRSCGRELQRSWFLSSFTQLASQALSRQETGAEAVAPDHDEIAAEPMPPASDDEVVAAPTGIFALPPGPRTGDCLHKILENFDFAADVVEPTRSLVRRQLDAFNLSSPSRALAIEQMLECLRLIPMDPSIPTLTLARVPSGHRLTELEFHFPATAVDANQLLALIRGQGPFDAPPASGAHTLALPMNPPSLNSVSLSRPLSRTVQSDQGGGKGHDEGPGSAFLPESKPHNGFVKTSAPSDVRAFLKGFIDLVFLFEDRYHIIDWKSNLLGNRTEDYSQAAMKLAIEEHCYDLQYHIYVLALHKFLGQRVAGYDYDSHFGGVHYVFLRGLEPGHPELGVFHDRPSRQTLDRLLTLFGAFAEGQP